MYFSPDFRFRCRSAGRRRSQSCELCRSGSRSHEDHSGGLPAQTGAQHAGSGKHTHTHTHTLCVQPSPVCNSECFLCRCTASRSGPAGTRCLRDSASCSQSSFRLAASHTSAPVQCKVFFIFLALHLNESKCIFAHSFTNHTALIVPHCERLAAGPDSAAFPFREQSHQSHAFKPESLDQRSASFTSGGKAAAFLSLV